MTQAAVDVLALAREQVLDRGEGLTRDQVLAEVSSGALSPAEAAGLLGSLEG